MSARDLTRGPRTHYDFPPPPRPREPEKKTGNAFLPRPCPRTPLMYGKPELVRTKSEKLRPDSKVIAAPLPPLPSVRPRNGSIRFYILADLFCGKSHLCLFFFESQTLEYGRFLFRFLEKVGQASQAIRGRKKEEEAHFPFVPSATSHCNGDGETSSPSFLDARTQKSAGL